MKAFLFAIALSLPICSLGWAEEAAQSTENSIKWEYKVIGANGSSKSEKLAEELNSEGQKGWELVGILSGKEADQQNLIFKRKIETAGPAQVIIQSVAEREITFLKVAELDMFVVQNQKKQQAILEGVAVEAVPELDVVIIKGNKDKVNSAIKAIEKLQLAKVK